jgi:hypothetical protein
MVIPQHIDEKKTSNIICEWEDNCLSVPLFGYYDDSRFYETLCAAYSVINHQKTPYWTRIIEITEEANTNHKNAEEMAKQFDAFFLWAEQKGCYASALVIKESQLSAFSLLVSLSENLHNGVRLFFDREIATQWLSIQQQKHRQGKMH